VEALAAGDEDLALMRQVGTTRLDEIHERQPVLACDLHGSQVLAHRRGRRRAAAHGGIVRRDHARDALDEPDAAEHARADGEVRAPCGQRRQLEQRRGVVDEQLDALASEQLAALAVAGDVLLATAPVDRRQLGVVLGELLEQARPVARVLLAADVDVAGEDRHGRERSEPRETEARPSQVGVGRSRAAPRCV
jgi:hypothetical protein